MSDQISEKMARNCYRHGAPGTRSQTGEDRFIENLRAAGLIKPSALDEALEWLRENDHARGGHEKFRAYAAGVRDCAARFEAAITEIMEDKS